MIEILHYKTEDGKIPFTDWMDTLDRMTKARIAQHIDRMKFGNTGDTRHLRNGVSEKKINTGPGYRLYFSREGSQIIVLLCGGDKGTQDRDIDRAVSYLHDHVERNPR